jgi:hypothetical protein
MYSLAEITGGIKGASRSLSIRELGRRGRLWQTESFDRVVRSSESLDAKLAYILDHPVRGGLVAECGDYVRTRRRVEHPLCRGPAARLCSAGQPRRLSMPERYTRSSSFSFCAAPPFHDASNCFWINPAS